MFGIHFPSVIPGGLLVRSDFTPLDIPGMFGRQPPVYGGGQISHYWTKSFEEFSIKKWRGDFLEMEDNSYQRNFREFFDWNGDEVAANRAAAPAALIDRVKIELHRLESLPGVAMHQSVVRDSLADMLARFDPAGGLRALYEKSRGESGTPRSGVQI